MPKSMEPTLYRAAVEGDFPALRKKMDQFGVQVMTGTGNTVLHVIAQFQDSEELVEKILEVDNSLLYRVNSRGDTAVHIAARKGHPKIIRGLIGFAKKLGEDPESMVGITRVMLRETNKDGDTALHEAVRNNHLEVVGLLVDEDPDEFSHSPNKFGETPLYLAAERGCHQIVSKILTTYTSPPHSGPNGRTALHAAVLSNCSECVGTLLDRNPTLFEEADSYGWTGLQLAASVGHVEVMEMLLAHRPDCWETVNSRGQNILHIAIENEKVSVIRLIIDNSWLRDLLNQKDINERTPIHLLAGFGPTISDLRGGHKGAFNPEYLTPKQVSTSTEESKTKEDETIIEQLLKVHVPQSWRNLGCIYDDRIETREPKTQFQTSLLVATLTATVTFAAGFTLPGGYDGNDGPDQGMAVLVRKAAFQAFVISNTIAVVFSNSALFLFYIALGYRKKELKEKKNRRGAFGGVLLFIALCSMMTAFITGTYVVLAKSSGLIVAVCIIGSLSLIIYCWCFYRRVHDHLKARKIRSSSSDFLELILNCASDFLDRILRCASCLIRSVRN